MSSPDWAITEYICHAINITLIPLSIYLVIKQCSLNHYMYMKKRSLSLYYALNISLTMSMAGLAFLGTALVYQHTMITIIANTIGQSCLFVSIYFLLVKSWMTYYKYKWTYYTMEFKWSYIINPNSASTEADKNWFICNNKTYGNLWYIYRLFAVLTLIPSIIVISACNYSIYTQFEMIRLIIACGTLAAALGTVAIFYTYLVRHTPFINDPYQIHWELKLHSRILIPFGISNGLMSVAVIIFGDFHAFLIGAVAMNLCSFAMVFVSTYCLSRYQREKLQLVRNGKYKPKSKSTNSITYTVDAVLSNEALIHSFMVHLSKEYSMEILLSYIEIIQFQKYIAERMAYDDDTRILNKVEMPEFPSNIPKSEIIGSKGEIIIDTDTDDMFLDNAKIKAYKLYKKYIKTGSEFEVNLCADAKHKLANVLDELDALLSYNINLKDLFLLFEECKQEMKTLQTYSLVRFKNGDELTDDI